MSEDQTQTTTGHGAPEAKPSILKNKWVQSSGLIAVVLLMAGSVIYWQKSTSEVAIDTSIISAPTIGLSAIAGGQLQQTYVSEGQMVSDNTVVARVGTELIKTQVAGIVASLQTNIGAAYAAGQPVATIIQPSQLRVVGTIEENKGLNRIKVGQSAAFTVDAFGSKTYQGVVDEISPMANQQSVVFNISDQRATQQFSVKVRFDPAAYPELKNGMSAKLVVYTK